jgi:hypothetical protein
MFEQDIEVVIAKHALCPASINKIANEINDCGAVRATVGQISNKDEASALEVCSVIAVAQMSQQRAQRADLTVDIAHDVERTVEEGLDEGGHRHHHFCNLCITDQTSCSDAHTNLHKIHFSGRLLV